MMRAWRGSVLALAATLGVAALPVSLLAQQPQVTLTRAASGDALAQDWARKFWTSAQRGDDAAFIALLNELPQGDLGDPGLLRVREAAAQLREHFGKREETRTKRISELREELTKALAEAPTDISLSKALRSAVELDVLMPERGSIKREPDIRTLVSRAETAARDAESRGDALAASELFVRLNALFEEEGTYLPDVRRQTQRLAMLRLYVPQELWRMRNERLVASGEKPLPEYNPFGDDYRDKLEGINQTMVVRALAASPQHVEKPQPGNIIAAGLEGVRVMLTTRELSAVFEGLTDERRRNELLAFVAAEQVRARNAAARPMDTVALDTLLDALRRKNRETVNLPDEALLHEFANAALGSLDDYSSVIWPAEVRRFERNTQGRLVGVGVQIEFDEQSNIRVVTPLEGSPAQRAGVQTGDVIKKVDGRNVFGIALDQAVDVITGPAGTKVTLTLEREIPVPEGSPEGTQPTKQEIEVTLTRQLINVATVRGWNRTGAREDAWDWFVDRESKIGYVRLSQFTDTTTAELDRAIARMREQGLNALIMDLRFNPGGLLDQAVSVARRMLDIERAPIVMTQGPTGVVGNPEYTRPSQASLASIPVVVLVNEGSASASEIVSGAVGAYAREGKADAVLLGARSFGKGSVQNVTPLTSRSMMKLTMQYYLLPDRRIIHRRPGNVVWGVEPNLHVEMLPEQTGDAIRLRRDADIIPLEDQGVANGQKPRPDPTTLLRDGMDLQLEAAVLVLRARLAGGKPEAITQRDGGDAGLR